MIRDRRIETVTYQRWQRWMELGEKTGCHQRPERSFFVKGYQLPVCARCCGVILGYMIALPCFVVFKFKKCLSIGGCFVMFLDWLMQALKVKKSTNRRRVITGVLGGYGIMSIQLYMIKKMILFFCKLRT